MAWHWDEQDKAWITSEEKSKKQRLQGRCLCFLIGIAVSGFCFNWAFQTTQEMGWPLIVGLPLSVLAAIVGFVVGYWALPVGLLGCGVVVVLCVIALVFTSSWDDEEAGSSVPDIEKVTASAEEGDASAQFRLGLYFHQGKEVEKDAPKALKWYHKAAEKGHAEAQYNLGGMYAKGEGVPKDFKEAGKWYREAAEQGLAEAQYMLGVMLEKGEGVELDYEEAKTWYRKAAEQGFEDAKRALEENEKR